MWFFLKMTASHRNSGIREASDWNRGVKHPLLNICELTKSSHWLFVMEVDPGNFSRFFKPVFISTSPVCPAAIYLYNRLCGLFPSSATKTWLYFMLIFSLFCLFSPLRCESMLPSSASLRKHPPSLDFSKYFLLMHARLYHQRGFPSSDVLSLCRCFRSVSGADRGEFSADSGRDGSRSGRFLQVESLLLSVISSRFWPSARMNKMAACCFYSSDTGGKGRRRARSWGDDIRREWGREGEKKRGVFVGVRECP